MKVVYFGSDVFLSCFEYFLSEHEILALYTYHNDEDYFNEYSITRLAKENGIPIFYEDITVEAIEKYIHEDGCGMFFVAEYDRIIPIPEGLDEFKGINTHSSLLPQGRSYYPIEAAMERGLCKMGVTMHKLVSKLDKGDIILQRSFSISDDTDSIDIYLECAKNASEMVRLIFGDIEKYWNGAKPQTGKYPYWNRPQRELMRIDHNMTCGEANEIFRKYNSMTEVELGGRMYYVRTLTTGRSPVCRDEIYLSPDRVLYRAADGHLRLHILLREETT